MHLVGIDLAWGERNPTGLAVLDDDARLLATAAVRTDEEIAAWLAPFVAGECVVGIDAPIVVRNPTGSRPAEKALSQDFRRYDAGAHPANTGKPEFAGGTRAARVAALLGLDVDPEEPSARRAIEVYPHPATVVLLGLDRILQYKHKTGRDVDLLRGELLRLMDGMAARVRTGEAWAELRAQVTGATRKHELRRVEDQVDAVVCAYVAWLARHRPETLTAYGDRATGRIVTPALRPDPAAVYAADHAELEEAGHDAVALVTQVLDEAGINYLSVTGRTKSVASFTEKAGRERDGARLYDDPLGQITDQLGVRVITYVADDVDAVAELLSEQVVVTDDRDLGQETARQGRFGYASRHLLFGLDPAREGHSDFERLRGRTVQVQVRTVVQHAWAEFEHEVRYKGTVPEEHARELDRRFTLAAGLLELADREFSEIRHRLRGLTPDLPTVEADDPRIDPRELAGFLAAHYADAAWSRAEHYRWISGLLLAVGVTTLDELADTLRGADEGTIADRMAYRQQPGAIRRLDDALLWVHGAAYADLDDNSHRRDALRARLGRLRGETEAAP